jgi:hypothetical protein
MTSTETPLECVLPASIVAAHQCVQPHMCVLTWPGSGRAVRRQVQASLRAPAYVQSFGPMRARVGSGVSLCAHTRQARHTVSLISSKATTTLYGQEGPTMPADGLAWFPLSCPNKARRGLE